MRKKEHVDLAVEATKLTEAVSKGDIHTAYTISGRIQRATREAITHVNAQAMVPGVSASSASSAPVTEVAPVATPEVTPATVTA